MTRYITGTSIVALVIAMQAASPAFAQAAPPQTSPSDAQATVQPADQAAITKSADPVADSDQDSSKKADKPSKTLASESPEKDIEVTGSRLANGDPTQHVIVIDRREIERRGVTSVDDLIRTLPQNLATIGPITNDRTKGPLVTRSAPVSALGSLGVSAANLGGTGAGNTLILINGRRIAGAAGIEDGFINLNSIPLAAIERVEISQSGASAIYGADAIGGVINFILKSGYRGLNLSSQYENYSNGGDRVRLNGYAGVHWKGGSLSGTVDYTRTNPVENAKTGYVTENYAPQLGGNPRFNFLNFARGLQPGVIDTSFSAYYPSTGQYLTTIQGLQPRAGLTGKPAISDFVLIGQSAARDYITQFAGPKTDSISATYDFEQNITSQLKFFSTGIVTRATNTQFQDLSNGLTITLAPGQYYNPFPAYYFNGYSPGTAVNYFPGTEIANGTLKPGQIRAVNTTWSVNAGLSYDFTPNTRLSVTYTRSRSDTTGTGTMLGNIAAFRVDPTSPNGVTCYDPLQTNLTLTATDRAARAAAVARQCAALTSTDPAVAFNPFGAGGSSVSNFIYQNTYEQLGSNIQLVEARLQGRLFKLPAGTIQFSAGGEYSTDGVNSKILNVLTGSAQSRSRYAFYGESNIPIVGGDFTLPLVHSLLVNLAGRDDTYLTTGAVGTVGNVPYTLGGALVFQSNRFSRFTPAYGFRWEPVRTVAILGRWSQGFKPPPYSQLFSSNGTTQYTTLIINDPYYQCTTDCTIHYGTTTGYSVPSVVAPNPNLRPQTSNQKSFTFSWAPDSFLHGLSFNATYNETDTHNEYANPNDLQSVLTYQQILAIPLFYPRDATGKVTSFQSLTFNLIGSQYQSMTYELRYPFDTRFGTFEPSVVAVQNLRARRQEVANAPALDVLGTILGPDRYRLTGQLTWTLGNVSATVIGYYTPPYTNDYFVYRSAGVITDPQDVLHVNSYTTFDFTASWFVAKKWKIDFVSRNMFDAAPPFTLVDRRPYDTARYNVAGRTLSLQLTRSL